MWLRSEDSLVTGPLLEMALGSGLCKELFSPQGTCSSASLSEHFACPGCRTELREMLKGFKAPGDTSESPKEVPVSPPSLVCFHTSPSHLSV